jgi:putative transcriptional regulator
MQKIFIETDEFTAWVAEYLSDDDLAALQRELLADPEKGVVMPGCGGLRKLRIANPRRGKGKRGGAQVIYLHIEEVDQVRLITVYGKDQKDDLSAADKKLFRQHADALKQEVKRPKRL